MGLIGVICALEAQTGNEDATIKFLIMSGFCIAGILLVKGTLGFINKVKYIFGSKVNCTVSIMAECSNVVKNKLTFCVQVVDNCEVKFDEELIIFKFWSKEYPEIIEYSVNNSLVR